ncbi:hypothetical protein, partial [uncultured Duncaniella sp.]
ETRKFLNNLNFQISLPNIQFSEPNPNEVLQHPRKMNTSRKRKPSNANPIRDSEYQYSFADALKSVPTGHF